MSNGKLLCETGLKELVKELNKKFLKKKELHLEDYYTKVEVDENLESKLNKNQGIENQGKVLTVDEQGNVIPTEFKNGSDNILIGTVEKQENPYIEDSYETELRKLNIYGKSSQVQEIDLVPTPTRPIPIISKKIKVNDEYVELRSLKESVNLFDKVLHGFEVGLLNYDGIILPTFTSYFTSGFVPVSTNKQYIRGIIGVDGYTVSGVFFYDKNFNFLSKTDKEIITVPSDVKYLRFGVSKAGGNVDELNEYVMLVEGDKLPTSYVAPTIRDYKIVDHTKKESKIVRNVNAVTFDGSENWKLHMKKTNSISFNYDLNLMKNENMLFSDKFKNFKSASLDENGISNNGISIYLSIEKSLLETQDVDGLKKWLSQNPTKVVVSAKTTTEEPIPYIETDTSDFGVSFQDSTTPSPSIPSEITSIDEVDLTVCGKNLFDGELEVGSLNINNGLPIANNSIYRCKDFVEIPSDEIIYGIASVNFDYGEFWVLHYDESKQYLGVYNHLQKVPKGTKYIKFYCVGTNAQNFLNDKVMLMPNVDYKVSKIQETDYEPYTEPQYIQFTPPQPLYSTLDGSIADEVDVVNGVYRYNKVKIIAENKKLDSTCGWVYGDKMTYGTRKDIYKNIPISACNYQDVELNPIYMDNYGNITNIIKPSVVSNIDEWIEYIKDKKMEFLVQLKTPTEISIPQDILEQLKKLKTYTGVTNIICNAPISCQYEQSIKIVIENIMKQLQTITKNTSSLNKQILMTQEAVIESDINNLLGGLKDE